MNNNTHKLTRDELLDLGYVVAQLLAIKESGEPLEFYQTLLDNQYDFLKQVYHKLEPTIILKGDINNASS